MLTLITGKPGSFKTAKTATLAIEYLKQGRPVYTNIAEFDYDGVQKLPENDDWTQTPDGSVIIYDEAQQFDFLKHKGREKLSTDKRVTQFEVHRHTGHDIILVTQSPSFIHNHVLSLVGSHYHLHRAYGRAYADVFLWRYTATTPDSSAAKNKAESHEKFKPDSKIFDKYKSTTLDTHKLKVPKLFFKLGGFILCILIFISYMVFFSNNSFISYSEIKKNKEVAEGKQKVQSDAPVASQPQETLDLKCRKAENLDLQECKEYLNKATRENADIVDYDPNKPYATQVKKPYEVLNQPRFSGCMKINGKYRAYTEQGTVLHGVAEDDCRR